MSTAPLNVLIVGAGKIGAGFDAPGDADIWTHAHAFSRNDAFRLAGFVDANPAQAQEAVSRWGGQAFVSIEEAFAASPNDVVCIATPDETHAILLAELLNFPVRLVFCEKPLATDIRQAEALVHQYRSKGRALLVNYTRRFVPEFQKLRNNIQNGCYGAFQGGSAMYGKGFVHNGSHLVDLLRFLIGEIDRVEPQQRIPDFTAADPSLSVLLRVAGQPFWLQAIDSRLYTIFEADLFFERARVRMLGSGFQIAIDEPKACPRFAGYETLSPTATIDTHLPQAMREAARNIAEHLLQGSPLLCPAEEALKTLSVVCSVFSLQIAEGRS